MSDIQHPDDPWQPPELTREQHDAASEQFDPDNPDDLRWTEVLEKEAKEKAEAEEAEEQLKYDAEERRRKTAADNIRREREQAEISGTLAPDAELFYEALRAKVVEAHDFQPTVRVPIVQGLFNGNSLSWVAGSSGTFKSFMTADLAFRYGSSDMDYHGRKMTHGRALIIVAEGDGSYADRKTAWERQYQREVKNVAIYPGALQLADVRRDMAALLHFLRVEEEAGQPFGLIVVDTQAMCTVGIDENSSEMNLVVNVLHRIRQTSGACVMPVHHFGKDTSKGMRGSTVVYAAADTVLVLKRDKDAMVVDLSTAQSDGGKQKDNANESNLMRLEMRIHNDVNRDYFGDPVTSLAAVKADAPPNVTDPEEEREEVLAPITDLQCYYLQALSGYRNRGTSPSDFAKDAELPDEDWPRLPRDHQPHRVTRQSARKIFIKLEALKLVEPVKGDEAKWRMTPLGGSAVLRHLSDREGSETAQKWMERASRPRVQRGVPNPGANPLPNPGEPWTEPPSDLREP